MHVTVNSHAGLLGWFTIERLSALSVGVLVAFAVTALSVSANGWWFVDAMGRPVATDFIDVWAAGRLAIEGHPAAVYDWPTHQAMEDSAVGYRFDGYYGWHYPPTFLLAALPLAALSYIGAWFAWIAATAAFFAWTVNRIVGLPRLLPLFLAAPAAAWCAVVGQNGFLTAGLIGGCLTCLEKRPLAAGVCLGLLTYKPQFGLLFPVALLAGRRWTALGSATVAAAALALVSALAFGADTWAAFLGSVSTTVNDVLRVGGSAWFKIQSVYALAHQLGAGESVAWAAQAAWMLLFAATVADAWRRPGCYNAKAALVATAAIAASPYAYIYDAVILLIPVAFLVREGIQTGWRPGEQAALTAAFLLPLFFPVIGSATAPLACLVLAVTAVRRLGHGGDIADHFVGEGGS